jgi:hypothetical protein
MDSSIGPPEVGQSLAQFFFLGKKIIIFFKKSIAQFTCRAEMG